MQILNIKDVNGNWVTVPAIKGPQGDRGPAGADGHTPVKGVDYWTAEDQQAIIDAVLAALSASGEPQ